MTPERAIRLERIGFNWSPKDPSSALWDIRFLEVVQFAAKHGHARVPSNFQENPNLSEWVSSQRQEYKLRKRGLASQLTSKQIDLLTNVGFVFDEAEQDSQEAEEKGKCNSPIYLSSERAAISHPMESVRQRDRPITLHTANNLSWLKGRAPLMTKANQEASMNLLRMQPNQTYSDSFSMKVMSETGSPVGLEISYDKQAHIHDIQMKAQMQLQALRSLLALSKERQSYTNHASKL